MPTPTDPDAAFPDPPSDPQRLADLERRVAALEAALRQSEARQASALRAAVPAARPPRKAAQPLGFRWPEVKSEDVLGKVGIALVLVGVLFLLKYTLDRDLLTPGVRVAGAGLVGVTLLGLGLRLQRSRRGLGRLLLGGGIAALYGTLWTAASLYPLLSPGVAFVGLGAVAALALGLAVRERDAALSVVGTLGGLMMPIILYREPGQMAGLAAYTALLVGGAGAVYARQGWRGLLAAAALGGWAALGVAWLVGLQPGSAGATGLDRGAFSLGVLVTFVATGLVPLWRLYARPPRKASEASSQGPEAFGEGLLVRAETLATFAAPLLAFGLLDAAWAWGVGPAVVLLAGLAAAYGLAAARTQGSAALFTPLALAAAALAAWAAGRGLGASDGRTLATAVALGCTLVALARRDGLDELRWAGHVVALSASVVLGVHLYLALGAPWDRPVALGGGALVREAFAALLAIGALGAVGFMARPGSRTRLVYVSAAHLAVLLLLRLLLRPLAEGPGLTSAAWGVYAIVTIVAGLRLRDDVLRQIGLGTVLVTVAKVLLLDLSQIPTPWRVLLFMGLGGLLLLVSYLVPSLLKGSAKADPGAEADLAPAPPAGP